MPRNHLSQRYNADLLRKNEFFDAEFHRLFWNPLIHVQPQRSAKVKIKRKRTRKRFGSMATTTHRCPDCTARFRWRSPLRYHYAYHHRGEQLNVCPEASCGLNFQFPYQLTNHQRTSGHHDWQIVCQECSKRFRAAEFLKRHTVVSCNRYKLESKKRTEQ